MTDYREKAETASAADYADIINLPHHVSAVHPPMPVEDRAAQFAPFAALSGYEGAIRETARLNEQQVAMEVEHVDEWD